MHLEYRMSIDFQPWKDTSSPTYARKKDTARFLITWSRPFFYTYVYIMLTFFLSLSPFFTFIRKRGGFCAKLANKVRTYNVKVVVLHAYIWLGFRTSMKECVSDDIADDLWFSLVHYKKENYPRNKSTGLRKMHSRPLPQQKGGGGNSG